MPPPIAPRALAGLPCQRATPPVVLSRRLTDQQALPLPRRCPGRQGKPQGAAAGSVAAAYTGRQTRPWPASRRRGWMLDVGPPASASSLDHPHSVWLRLRLALVTAHTPSRSRCAPCSPSTAASPPRAPPLQCGTGADKACVDCAADGKACVQCAGREARETVGLYGEKDAYKPYVLDAAKGTCLACDPKGDRGCDLAAGCGLAGGAPVCTKCAVGFYQSGTVEGGVSCSKCEWRGRGGRGGEGKGGQRPATGHGTATPARPGSQPA